MQRFLRLALWAALLCPAAPATGADVPGPPSSKEILDHVFDLFRGDSSFGTFSMTVVTAHCARELTMAGWSKEKDLSLIRILAPRKEQGLATLKDGNNVWNYLPRVKQVIKIPSSMMGESWMGSHFKNDDLVKECRMAEDYTHRVSLRAA